MPLICRLARGQQSCSGLSKPSFVQSLRLSGVGQGSRYPATPNTTAEIVRAEENSQAIVRH